MAQVCEMVVDAVLVAGTVWCVCLTLRLSMEQVL